MDIAAAGSQGRTERIELMTTHTLDNLDQSNGTLNGWVATCSCHNPDGDGEGRADFPGVTALEAVRAWQEHADQTPTCQHLYPAEFATADVTWSPDGLHGRAVLPCGQCGEYVRFDLEEES